MGANQSAPDYSGNMYTKQKEHVEDDELEQFFTFPSRIDKATELTKEYQCNCLATYTVVDSNDPLKEELQKYIFSNDGETNSTFITSKESRGIASFLGMVIGDALGAPLEFSRLTYNDIVLKEFEEISSLPPGHNKFELKPGQWTDDSSMGLCLAESLLCYPDFNPIDLRIRFLNWWDFGYRNAFGTEFRHSVGLGGCIGMSMTEFKARKSEYTIAGDENTSGNGSIMRLAAVPIFYHDNIEKALDVAEKQSKTTHQGNEAAECARLMTYIIISLLNSDKESPLERKHEVLSNLKDNFSSSFYSIQCLRDSLAEERCPNNKDLNLEDRNWDWKSDTFKYAPNRATSMPQYIGSYAMDGMAMSLHCIWTTNSFREAITKVINLRGDADTVGSITGQMAGALYGVEDIPKKWIEAIQQWDNEGDIALTSLKLCRKLTISKE